MERQTTPVSFGSVIATLRAQGRDLVKTKNNLVTVEHSSATFFWSTENPQVSQLRAQWRGASATTEDFNALREIVSHYNATCAFPKTYMVPLGGNGRYTVAAECNLITCHDTTDLQIYGFLDRATTALGTFIAEVSGQMSHLEI